MKCKTECDAGEIPDPGGYRAGLKSWLGIFLALILLTVSLNSSGQDFSHYGVTTEPLAPNLYLVTGAGGNQVAHVGPGGIILVDSNYEEMAEKVVAALDSLSEFPVSHVVNTHWHFDHVGGNATLAQQGSEIIAHVNVTSWMAAPQHIDIIDRDVPASPVEALPTITFTDSLVLDAPDGEIAIVHHSWAHTDGDAVVHFRGANVIHLGDIFFNCGYPFIDVNHGGSIDGMIAAVENVLPRCDADTRLIPGHGPVGDREDLTKYLRMLRSFRDAVANKMRDGQDLEQILASGATAEIDAEFGQNFFPPSMFTDMVLRTLENP